MAEQGAVVVTGAGSGIGAATARLLARRGRPVALLDLREDRAEAIAGELRGAGGSVIALGCDVADEDAVAAAFDRAGRELGEVRGAVTSAGIDRGGLAHELGTEQFDLVLAANLRGTFLTCKHALRAMLAHGRGGAIVCVSSPAAVVAFPNGASAYCASKGGVSAFVRTLAVDYARHGVRVNAVAPGPTESELMWANVPAEDVPRMRGIIETEVPLARMAEPDEIARPIAWLLSDEASYCTGGHLYCDGGVTAKASISV